MKEDASTPHSASYFLRALRNRWLHIYFVTPSYVVNYYSYSAHTGRGSLHGYMEVLISFYPTCSFQYSLHEESHNLLSTTIYLWLISLTASKELSILLLKLYNDGAIGISSLFLDIASAIQTDNQLLICSVRFMQVELPLVRSCHTTVDWIGNE